MKKEFLNDYSAPMVEFYNVAIERGFGGSDERPGMSTPDMDSTEDDLEFGN